MNCINSLPSDPTARFYDILTVNIYLNKFDIYPEAADPFHHMVLSDKCELVSVKHDIAAIMHYKVDATQ